MSIDPNSLIGRYTVDSRAVAVGGGGGGRIDSSGDFGLVMIDTVGENW